MRDLVDEPRLAAAFGKFRTRNRRRNLLTRFINLETLAFQFMVQSGSSEGSVTSTLPPDCSARFSAVK